MTERTELARRRARLSPAKQARLAEWITGEDRRRPIQRRRDPGPAQLSFAQERLWFMEQLLPGTHANELPTALTLAGPLDLDVLERALTEIVRRHDALRTRFPAPGGRAVQVVDPPWPVALTLVESDDAPAFDLAADRLIRLSLARIGPQEHQLRVLAHHIVSDAWSQRLLVHELAALCEAFAAGRASPLAELPIQYADFAVWQRDQLAGPALTAQLDYWRAQLAGPPPVLELPADRPRPPVPTYGGATLRRRLPAPLLTALRDLAQRTNTTFYMVVLAGLATLLHRCSGDTDITIGTPLAGRTHVDVAELIGFFANPVVLRIDVSDDPTVGQLLHRVRETVMAAFSHADVPFAQVVDAVRPPRRLGHTALYQVQLVVQDPLPPVSLASGLSIDVATMDARGSQFDLAIVLSRDVCRIDYSTDLFDPGTATRLAEHLEVLLGGIVSGPDRRLSALPLPGIETVRRARPSIVDEPRSRMPFRQPRTALEQTIAGIWAEALSVDRVGLDDSFFDLGGHSVLLIQVHNRVCAEVGQRLDMVDAFAHPTVGALAEHFSALAHAENPDVERIARSRQAADARRAALARLTGNPGAGGPDDG